MYWKENAKLVLLSTAILLALAIPDSDRPTLPGQVAHFETREKQSPLLPARLVNTERNTRSDI